MKALKILSVAVLLIFSSSWNTSDLETVAPNKSEKKLAILLKGYKKMTKTKVLSNKEVLAFNKKKITSKGLKATKVAVIEYVTKGKKTARVYTLEINDELMFLSHANRYTDAVTYEAEKEEDCEIIVDSCGGDNCSCYCVVSDSCDPSGESDPDCCADCTCEEDDGIGGGFDDFMETLMP